MDTTDAISNNYIHEQLQELQKGMQQIQNQRRLRSAIGIAGFIGIMIIVVLFLFDLRNYVVKYPSYELTSSLAKNAEVLMTEPVTYHMLNNLRQRATDVVLPEVVSQIQKESPRFKNDLQAIKNRMHAYLNGEIQEKASQQLSRSLEHIHAELLKSYTKIPVEDINKASQLAQQHYVAGLQSLLTRHLMKSSENIQTMEKTLLALEHSQDAQPIKGKSPENLQNDFYAAILELALYSLQPERGALVPAHYTTDR